MNKKYQVFVSSTYKDLKEERMAVIRLLLKNGLYSCRNGTVSCE